MVGLLCLPMVGLLCSKLLCSKTHIALIRGLGVPTEKSRDRKVNVIFFYNEDLENGSAMQSDYIDMAFPIVSLGIISFGFPDQF